MPKEEESIQEEEQDKKIGFWQIVFSTLAAAIGVQSKANLKRDFSQSSPFPFIVAGLVFTVIFMGCLIVAANLMLHSLEGT